MTYAWLLESDPSQVTVSVTLSPRSEAAFAEGAVNESPPTRNASNVKSRVSQRVYFVSVPVECVSEVAFMVVLIALS